MGLVLTLKVDERVVIDVPGGEPIEVICVQHRRSRCSVLIEAPKEYKINLLNSDGQEKYEKR